MVSLETPVCEFGLPTYDFELRGVDGKTWSLSDCKGEEGLLVMFICNHCPYVKAVIDRIVRDTNELEELGIGSVGIMSNDLNEYAEDSFDNMKVVAEKNGFRFPYLIDTTQEIAKRYGAICTPDFFGYNADLQLQYRGRLDESGKAPANPGVRRELFEGLKLIAQTGRGPDDQTPSMGCSIKWINN